MGEETRSRTRAGKHAALGWFSPPHFSRDVARCGHPLRLRCRRSVSLSRVVSSVAAPCGASERRACITTGDARATRAVGGSRRRSRAGPFAHAAVVSSSLALLPSGRRSSSSSSSRAFSTAAAPCGARALASRRGTRARRARRATRAVGGSRRRSRAGPIYRALWCPCRSWFCSRPVRRSARAAPSLRPRAGGVRAHHERARGRTLSATRRARCAASPRGVLFPLSQFAVCARRVCFSVWLCCPPTKPPLAPPLALLLA